MAGTHFLAGSFWLGLFLVLVVTLYGLAALWAVDGRAGWLARWAPIVLLLAAVVPIGAYDLLLMFGTQAITIIGGLVSFRIVRRQLARRRALANSQVVQQPADHERTFALPRYRLADALCAVLLVGALLAIVRFTPTYWKFGPPANPLYWLAWGACWGITILSVRSLAQAGFRWDALLMTLVTIVATIGLSIIVATEIGGQLIYSSDGWPPASVWAVGVGVVQGLAVFGAVWLMNAAGALKPQHNVALGQQPSASSATPSRRRMLAARATLGILTAATLGVLASAYWNLLPPRIATADSPPVPNGFEMLLRADTGIVWTTIPSFDADEVTGAECQAFAQANVTPLSLVHKALGTPSQVPLNYTDPNLSIPEVSAIRDLARALLAEGKAQTAAGKHDDAAQTYVDQMQLAHHCSHGGSLVHELVAMAIQGIAFSALHKSLDPLDARQLAVHRRQVQEIMASREPLDIILERDLTWMLTATGWQARLLDWALPGYFGPAEGAIRASRQRNETFASLLTTHMAIRQFQLERGMLPESLAHVVPDYLAVEPNDPFGEGPLIYRRTDDGYLLYSVGGNGKDDGGMRVPLVDATSGGVGDLFLDCPEVTYESPAPDSQEPNEPE